MFNVVQFWFDDAQVWTVDNGHWALDSGQWVEARGQQTVGRQWTVYRKWTADIKQWAVDSGQWAVDSKQFVVNRGRVRPSPDFNFENFDFAKLNVFTEFRFRKIATEFREIRNLKSREISLDTLLTTRSPSHLLFPPLLCPRGWYWQSCSRQFCKKPSSLYCYGTFAVVVGLSVGIRHIKCAFAAERSRKRKPVAPYCGFILMDEHACCIP
jgi:hypothetical protein